MVAVQQWRMLISLWSIITVLVFHVSTAAASTLRGGEDSSAYVHQASSSHVAQETRPMPPLVMPAYPQERVLGHLGHSAGGDNADSRIIGGTEVSKHEFPWQVACFNGGTFSCGASLIADRWVLTAAHCYRGCESVAIGLHDRTNVHKTIPVQEKFRHGLYGHGYPGNRGDAALLYLKESVGAHHKRVVLGDEDSICKEDDDVVVSGWGATREGGMAAARLQKVTVKYIPEHKCSEFYWDKSKGKSRITSDMMCAGTAVGGKDACQGDSGGPLHAMRQLGDGSSEYVQVGVVSWGYGCARAEYPGVYCRVSAIRDFMLKTMERIQPGSTSELRWYSDLKQASSSSSETTPPPMATSTPTGDDISSFFDMDPPVAGGKPPVFVEDCWNHYDHRQENNLACEDVHQLKGRRGYTRFCSWAGELKDVRCTADSALYCCPQTCGLCS